MPYKLKVLIVHKDEIGDLWPDLAPHFQRILDKNSETATLKGIKRRCINGDYLLMVAVVNKEIKMAVASEVVTCDTGAKILMIPQLGGIDMGGWIDELVAQFYLIADRLGCYKVMINGGRMGWAREMKKHGGEIGSVTVEFDVQKNIHKYKES